jgi:transcriptional regulator with XRE-family HTH domain
MNTQLLSIKAKKFGVRLTGFRQNKGVSIDQLSQWTGISSQEVEKTERGESDLSLPQIELIALRLGMMTENLLNGNLENNKFVTIDKTTNRQYTVLRDRMIGLILRKTRTEQNKEMDEVSSRCGISESDLTQYESGTVSLPWPVLECLCEQYDLPVKSLLSGFSQPASYTSQQNTQVSASSHLTEDLTKFIQDPANLPYLELAKKLSELDAAKLRGIAEGLLEITY